MKHYAGLAVSLKETSICIVDERRRVVKEAKVGPEPETISAWRQLRQRSGKPDCFNQ